MIRLVRLCAAVALIAAAVGLSGCVPTGRQAKETKPEAPVVSFGYSHTGSSAYDIYSYELRAGEAAEVFCEMRCGAEAYTLPASDAFLKDLEALIDRNALWEWNGFSETRSGVLDGYGFEMKIVYEGGRTVTASGSNCFPEGYGDAKSEIGELFLGYMKENGIEPEGES